MGRIGTIETRQLEVADFPAAVRLNGQLNTKVAFEQSEEAQQQFSEVLSHQGTELFGALMQGQVQAMVTLHLLPNMTYGGQPYAVIENVVTDKDHRGQGLARAAMQAAIDHAKTARAYKIMLLTGAENKAVGFYQALGFGADEKIGMILRLR